MDVLWHCLNNETIARCKRESESEVNVMPFNAKLARSKAPSDEGKWGCRAPPARLRLHLHHRL